VRYFDPGPQDSPPPWMTSLTAPAAGQDEDDDQAAAEDPAP
jgi:hypothetical protein